MIDHRQIEVELEIRKQELKRYLNSHEYAWLLEESMRAPRRRPTVSLMPVLAWVRSLFSGFRPQAARQPATGLQRQTAELTSGQIL